jgi:low temperature requirement protein LtrA
LSGQAQRSVQPLPASEQQLYDDRALLLQQRRVAALRARRRRLLAIDLGIAAGLALLGLVVAPGLAVLALFAFLVLLACAAWVLIERVRGRRTTATPTRGRRRR